MTIEEVEVRLFGAVRDAVLQTAAVCRRREYTHRGRLGVFVTLLRTKLIFAFSSDQQGALGLALPIDHLLNMGAWTDVGVLPENMRPTGLMTHVVRCPSNQRKLDEKRRRRNPRRRRRSRPEAEVLVDSVRAGFIVDQAAKAAFDGLRRAAAKAESVKP